MPEDRDIMERVDPEDVDIDDLLALWAEQEEKQEIHDDLVLAELL